MPAFRTLLNPWLHTAACATLLTERRLHSPYGLAGGEPGAPGENSLLRAGVTSRLPAKCSLDLEPGDVLSIATPGGGGWGRPDEEK